MYIHRLAENSLQEHLSDKEVLIILGARQAGKTTMVEHFLQGKNVLFLNFDIPAHRDKFKDAIPLDPAEALQQLGNPEIIVLDEAQRLPAAARIVKGWYDIHLPVKVILLGSSSLQLLDVSAESLTGRNWKVYLTPFLFDEILRREDWYGIYKATLAKGSSGFIEQRQSLLVSALVYGGYPKVLLESNREKYLTTLVNDYLFKDIFQLGLTKNPELIQRLARLLAHQVGSEVSINELATQLGINRATVERYVNILEQTFVIFRLSAYSTNPRKEISKSQKVYFWDTGARNALIQDFNFTSERGDIGHLWENWVVAECTKWNFLTGNLASIYFWRGKQRHEVDLVIRRNGVMKAFEIKWSNQKSRGRAFTNRYGITVTVITKDDAGRLPDIFGFSMPEANSMPQSPRRRGGLLHQCRVSQCI